MGLTKELNALAVCVPAMDELFEDSPELAAQVWRYVHERLALKLRLSRLGLEEKRLGLELGKRELDAKIRVYEKAREAELNDCLKVDENGKPYIDWQQLSTTLEISKSNQT